MTQALPRTNEFVVQGTPVETLLTKTPNPECTIKLLAGTYDPSVLVRLRSATRHLLTHLTTLESTGLSQLVYTLHLGSTTQQSSLELATSWILSLDEEEWEGDTVPLIAWAIVQDGGRQSLLEYTSWFRQTQGMSLGAWVMRYFGELYYF